MPPTSDAGADPQDLDGWIPVGPTVRRCRWCGADQGAPCPPSCPLVLWARQLFARRQQQLATSAGGRAP